jgi:hypothetical protein
MITLNKNLPYGEVLGQTADGCRYRQGKYRFTADGNVIGDTIQLEKEAKEEKIAELRAQLEAQMAEVKAMDAEIQMIAHDPSYDLPEAQAPVAPAPVAQHGGVHIQQAPRPVG